MNDAQTDEGGHVIGRRRHFLEPYQPQYKLHFYDNAVRRLNYRCRVCTVTISTEKVYNVTMRRLSTDSAY